MNRQDRIQIAQALESLSTGVVQAHDVPLGVMRHLTSYKELIAYALGVLVLGGRRQSRSAFGFVQRCAT